MGCYTIGKTGGGSVYTTLNRDICNKIGLKPGVKVTQEVRGNAIIIRRL